MPPKLNRFYSVFDPLRVQKYKLNLTQVFGELGSREAARHEASQHSFDILGVHVPGKPEEPNNCCMSGCVDCESEPVMDKSELEWAISGIKKLVVSALLVDNQEESWIRGTKALAMLHAKDPNLVNKSDAEVKKLLDCGPRSEAINHNLNMIN
ncbi:hypothetical protein FF38_05181 [Lucilia cuprina]|uniref:Oxidoreductase-like domain-containing protein n=1 Tax=Lucilia cuprina TaxID=7375 RepID=A0A0L0C5Y1_LUCCU|nr:hypothetical protein FF38_05181 [Lucilia cuprina]